MADRETLTGSPAEVRESAWRDRHSFEFPSSTRNAKSLPWGRRRSSPCYPSSPKARCSRRRRRPLCTHSGYREPRTDRVRLRLAIPVSRPLRRRSPRASPARGRRREKAASDEARAHRLEIVRTDCAPEGDASALGERRILARRRTLIPNPLANGSPSVSDALRTPGTRRARSSISRYIPSTAALPSRDLRRVAASRRTYSKWSASIPRSMACTFLRLVTNRPAPTSRSVASATCAPIRIR